MFGLNGKNASEVFFNSKPVSEIYFNKKLVWTKESPEPVFDYATILSMGAGFPTLDMLLLPWYDGNYTLYNDNTEVGYFDNTEQWHPANGGNT